MDIRISRPLLVAFLAGGLALSAPPQSQAQSRHQKQDQSADDTANAAQDAKDAKGGKGKADRKGGDQAQADPRAARQAAAAARQNADHAQRDAQRANQQAENAQAAARTQDSRRNDQRDRQQARQQQASERADANQRDAARLRGAQQQDIARAKQQQTWDRRDQHKADQRQFQADHSAAKAVEKQAKANDRADRRDRRISQDEQRKLITQQQRRVVEYRRYRSSQQNLALQVAAQLATQNRTAQSRYISNYQRDLLRQQQGWNNNYNYNNDPYFYSAPIYRYQRAGSYYSVNQYGANLLKQAVNAGYQEGIQAGRADRMDRWRSDYRNSFAYRDASYGYNGYYLSQDDYSYYFRQGFQRGYEDGYNSRYQYGRNSGGNYSILGTLLTSILGLQSY